MVEAHFHCGAHAETTSARDVDYLVRLFTDGFCVSFCVGGWFSIGRQRGRTDGDLAVGALRGANRAGDGGALVGDPEVEGSKADVDRLDCGPRVDGGTDLFRVVLYRFGLSAKSDRGANDRGLQLDPVRADLWHAGG